MEGCSGAMDVPSELRVVLTSSELESFVVWLGGVRRSGRFVEALKGVDVGSFLDLTRLTEGASPEDLRTGVVDLEARVLRRLADLESLSSFFCSSSIVSTVACFVPDLGRPAFLSVRGGLGGPLLMIRLRLANFSFEALTSVEGGVKRL